MGEGYAKSLLGDSQHWVRRLPGGLLQNVISHGIARISEFITEDNPQIIAHGFVSPFLQKLGERQIIDELRVIVRQTNGLTAYFTFSSQMRPMLHQFRVYGPKNGLVIDQDNETLIRLRGSRLKSYLAQFVPPIEFSRQYLRNFRTNLGTFLRNDFHSKAGMKFLIESFYRSITEDAPLPIPYREILTTSRIMDTIFAQLANSSGTASAAPQAPEKHKA